ncbi:MAG TPA: pirin family protein [Candidatus Binataceae bacterium]|nr:pirin family protein [Candidatus Binataceae bacterium]
MIAIRKAPERGRTHLDWLDSRHSFSFGDYHDPQQMGFRDLRVINDDRVAPAGGFATHGHRDMEIVTYVLDGELQHRDSLGNGSVIRPGEVQRMSAGTGIMHSEFNPSRDKPVHFLQIWILPEKAGLKPGYEQRSFDHDSSRGKFIELASRDAHGNELTVHQDVEISVATLAAGESVAKQIKPGRFGWLQVARGAVRLGDSRLGEGDGAAISDESGLELKALEPAELLFFDLR